MGRYAMSQVIFFRKKQKSFFTWAKLARLSLTNSTLVWLVLYSDNSSFQQHWPYRSDTNWLIKLKYFLEGFGWFLSASEWPDQYRPKLKITTIIQSTIWEEQMKISTFVTMSFTQNINSTGVLQVFFKCQHPARPPTIVQNLSIGGAHQLGKEKKPPKIQAVEPQSNS